MSWDDARAELVELLDGLTIAAIAQTSQGAEELTAAEFPPPGAVEPLPFAFVVGPEERWTFLPGDHLWVDLDEVTVRIYLGPGAEDPEGLERRRARWVRVIAPALMGRQTLGGYCVVSGARATQILRYGGDERPVAYGFDVVLSIEVSEIATAGA